MRRQSKFLCTLRDNFREKQITSAVCLHVNQSLRNNNPYSNWEWFTHDGSIQAFCKILYLHYRNILQQSIGNVLNTISDQRKQFGSFQIRVLLFSQNGCTGMHYSRVVSISRDTTSATENELSLYCFKFLLSAFHILEKYMVDFLDLTSRVTYGLISNGET